jgi:hypothetical protein
MANVSQGPNHGKTRRKKPNVLIFGGAVLIGFAVAAFLGAAFMWGVGAALWGPLPAWVSAATFWMLLGAVPIGALGLTLLVTGIIR